MTKTLKDYQEQIHASLQHLEKPYWDPLSQFARIVEEVGEVSRILNDKYGDKPKKQTEIHRELGDEIADVLFSIICLANSEGISLDAPLENVIAKVGTRDKDRFKKENLIFSTKRRRHE